MHRYFQLLIGLILINLPLFAQQNALVNTSKSKFAAMYCPNVNDVVLTKGFWAEWFELCRKNMVPHMMGNYMDEEISHAFTNFEIAAGLKTGEHEGPPFHDGDFYKMLEGLIMVYAVTKDQKTGGYIDSIVDIIGKTQRNDGYIHTPVVIEQGIKKADKQEFAERLDFETYNMGHLMTAACLHYRISGKKNLLEIAIKATGFLYDFYKRAPEVLAKNAICPSHYMGVTEMYRTTGDPRYLELAQQLIEIRGMVSDGTDHNQDRIPFKKQTKAQGHAVRANYLYAGAADVFMETGDDSLFRALDLIWHDLVERKLYITGACGALYDGVSPDGTSYKPPFIQQVHQAYGRDYQLPNLTAHNESCANIGNLLWNWRMLLATGEARFAEIMEQTMYNSLLAGVSLDGKGYFYTNPLCVAHDIPFELRWSKTREGYIGYCNCCPPNTIRTIAEIQNYFYALSGNGLWVHFYGGNTLKTTLPGGEEIALNQETDYPWAGDVLITVQEAPEKEFSLKFRIPSWTENAKILVNAEKVDQGIKAGTYVEIKRKWKKGDIIRLDFPMETQLIEANPLVEETRNQVVVRRGPVVYCLESIDIEKTGTLFNVVIPADIEWGIGPMDLKGQKIIALKGEAMLLDNGPWTNTLYKPVSKQETQKTNIRLIPYYAWGNREKADMAVWLPVSW